MKLITLLIPLLSYWGLSDHPGDKDQYIAAQNYIATYKQLAVVEMHRTGVPASITLAQALHESDKGRSDLALNANNHFGIKCKKYWKGSTFYHKDDDTDSRGQLIDSCFRSYDHVMDSYVDHSNFLKYGGNYQGLFTLSIMDYMGWAHGLKRAGYATDPHYADKLIRYIRDHKLYLLDSQDI